MLPHLAKPAVVGHWVVVRVVALPQSYTGLRFAVPETSTHCEPVGHTGWAAVVAVAAQSLMVCPRAAGA